MTYEYKIERFTDANFWSSGLKWAKLENMLNDLGNEGWHLQTVTPLGVGGNDGVIVFLQREKA